MPEGLISPGRRAFKLPSIGFWYNVPMKAKLAVCCLILLAIVIATLCLRYGGVTHESIRHAVVSESGAIKDRIDDRYNALDRKLDRIEGKLDRILEIATRPLPDNLNHVEKLP